MQATYNIEDLLQKLSKGADVFVDDYLKKADEYITQYTEKYESLPFLSKLYKYPTEAVYRKKLVDNLTARNFNMLSIEHHQELRQYISDYEEAEAWISNLVALSDTGAKEISLDHVECEMLHELMSKMGREE